MDAGSINPQTGVPYMMSTSYEKVVNALEGDSTKEFWGGGFEIHYNDRYFMVVGSGVVRIGELDSENRGRVVWSMEYNPGRGIVEFTPHTGGTSANGVPRHAVLSILKTARFSEISLQLMRRSKRIKNTDVYTDGRHALRSVTSMKGGTTDYYEELTAVGKDWDATFNGDEVDLYGISLPEFLLDTI